MSLPRRRPKYSLEELISIALPIRKSDGGAENRKSGESNFEEIEEIENIEKDSLLVEFCTATAPTADDTSLFTLFTALASHAMHSSRSLPDSGIEAVILYVRHFPQFVTLAIEWLVDVAARSPLFGYRVLRALPSHSERGLLLRRQAAARIILGESEESDYPRCIAALPLNPWTDLQFLARILDFALDDPTSLPRKLAVETAHCIHLKQARINDTRDIRVDRSLAKSLLHNTALRIRYSIGNH